MKKYFVFVVTMLVIAGSALAQDKKPAKPQRDPGAGRTMKSSRDMSLQENYPDSVEFKKAFEELYMIVKPKESVIERTEKVFKQQSRTFSRNGIDSTKAREAVFAAIDPKMDREVIYTTYRSQLSAEELKGWVAFLKTPAGKKILEVGNRLLTASDSKIDQTIRRSISNAVAPLRKPVQRTASPTTKGEGNAPVPDANDPEADSK